MRVHADEAHASVRAADVLVRLARIFSARKRTRISGTWRVTISSRTNDGERPVGPYSVLAPVAQGPVAVIEVHAAAA